MFLVVGAGYLGSYLIKHIRENSDERIIATVLSPKRADFIKCADCVCCDVTSGADVEKLKEIVGKETLDVFYFAACHNIDYVYENPKQAERINIEALEHFLSAFPNIRRLIFASTDCVYGEDNGKMLTENSEIRPISEYGRQKSKAENIVLNHGFTCARLPFMLGPSLIEKPHFYDKICMNLENHQPSEMIDGLYRSVLSYKGTAEILFKLITCKSDLPGVINVCGDKGYSKYEMGSIIAKNKNADLSLIKKISEKDGEKFFKDKRASSSVMDNSLLKSILSLDSIYWEEDKC